MAGYFIPITLLVLGGFALGLLVGRLAWGPSKSTTIVGAPPDALDQRQSAEPQATDGDLDTSASDAAEPSPEQDHEELLEPAEWTVDSPKLELPVWRMKEVRSRRRAVGSGNRD